MATRGEPFDFWRTAHRAVRGRGRLVLLLAAAGGLLGAWAGLMLGQRVYAATGMVRIASVLPQVLQFNATAAEAHYAEIASILVPGRGNDAASRAAELVKWLAQLPVELGLPTRLRDIGIAESDLDALAEDAMKQTRLLINNPREMTQADALGIYRAAL